MKKLFFLVVFVFCLVSASLASAFTVDLDALFDDDGELKFGDGSGSDFWEQTDVTRTFTLTEQPKTGGIFSISLDKYQIDYTDYFTINDHQFLNLEKNGNYWNSQSFTGDNSLLLFGPANTITFHVGASGANLDDFWIKKFELSYEAESAEGATVPEPTTALLFMGGFAGVVAWCRRKK